jgi:hypothetical protein
MRNGLRTATIGALTAVFSLGAAGCSNQSGDGKSATHDPASRMKAVRAAFPTARADGNGSGVTKLYGSALATGATPAEAASRFAQAYAAAIGLGKSDLALQADQSAQAASAGGGIGLMVDEKTGEPKFWLYRHAQKRGGLPVYHGRLDTLVRNDGSNAVVHASSTLRDLSGFVAAATAGAVRPNLAKALAAIRGTTDIQGRVVQKPTSLVNASAAENIIFAGNENAPATPRSAIQFTADGSTFGRWEFVADATTGDILNVVDLTSHATINGTVTAKITPGDAAMECAPAVAMAFPNAEVDGQTGEVTYTDSTGAFALTTSATGSVNVTSLMGGQYFDVTNKAGALENLTSAVVPPGPASFVHNSANTDVKILAQVNGYSNANEIRAFLLKYVPTYPTIAAQLNFPVKVNLSSSDSSTCPGNAFYDGSSLNLCLGNSSYTNTSFASVTHHEYGHHIISMAGSGQGEYGEGMADAIAALYAGAPGLGYGFYLNQCTTALRNADNTCQYSASSCSTCGSEIHSCGQLMSGVIWSIRKALAVTNPTGYADIINNLTLNSILLHTGTAINSQIAIDLITLDDNDGNIGNGSPHYNEICAGFTAHGMTCPPLLTDLSVTPTSTLAAEGPVGGPFAPASVTYTLTNLGPVASISYQVAPTTSTPWLSISNASGSLAINQIVQVVVGIDQAAAAGLAKGGYSASLQFTNLTNGGGNTTRAVALQVGAPQAIFTETFEGGLGTFTVDSPSSSNLWHVGASCASAQAGHSLPQSLYFGIDSSCTFANNATVAGTVTSVPITVADTSAVKLRFNYFVATEKLSSFDKAAILVSVNGGADTVVASNNQGGTILQDGTGAWQAAEVDLTSLFAGMSSATLRVRASFNSVDYLYNDYAGFLVDDVKVLAFAGGIGNLPPTVNAGPDQTITLPAGAVLTGTATDDGLPNPPAAMTYAWTKVSGPGTVTLGSPSSLATTATFSAAGTYTLRLTANDSALSSTDDVVVTVNAAPPINQAPVVNAGADQTITLPATASLAGTVTDDGLPNPPGAVTVAWSMVSGPGTVTFSNPSATTSTASFSVAGTYTLRLTANDSALASTDDLVVTVNPSPINQAPVVSAGPDQSVACPSLPCTVTLVGTVTDDGLPNPPGQTTSTWTKVSGPVGPTIASPSNPTTTVTFTSAGAYTFRLTATDSALTTSDDVIVTVSSVVNQAPVVNAGADQAITLPAPATLNGTVTDDGLPNPPATVTTTWTKVSGPGTVTFADPSAKSTSATFSTAGSYTLRLTASDSVLSTSDDVVITVSVTPINKAPVVNAGADQTITLPASASLAGTVTDDGLPNPPATVTTTWMKISGPGTVTFTNASATATTASFSTAGAYILRLTANDSALTASDDIIITVNAAPINKAPVVNAGADQTITLPATASLSATVTDDGLPNPPATVTTTWSKVSGPGTVTFANAGAKATTATFSISGSYTLRLTASDSALSASDDIVITVNPSASGPCAGLCTSPTNFTISGSFQSGNLGTGTKCYQTTSVVHGGNCTNFVSPRTLKVNGTTEPCNNGNWASVPAAKDGGYCIQVSAGNQSYAAFALW